MESPTLKDRLRHTPFLVLLSFTLWGLVAEMSGWFQDSPRFEQVSMTICVIICVTCVVLAIGVAFAYVRHPARTYRATVVFAWSLIGWDLYGAELLYIANAEFLGALVTVILPCTLLAFRKELAGFLRIPPVSLVIPYRLLLQRAGFVLAIAATGIALFYTFENWRWKRAWNNHVSEKKAAGEWFDLNVTPVPDEENFAMIPLLLPLAGPKHVPKPGRRVLTPKEFNVPNFSLTRTNDRTGLVEFRGNWRRAQAINLNAFQTYYRGETNFPPVLDRPMYIEPYLKQLKKGETGANVQFPTSEKPQSAAEDVLLALSIYRDDLAQLSQGLERPFTQFLEDYEPANIRFAHLAMSKGICMVLRTRATAQLEAGQLDNAVADVIDGYRIADRFTREPLLINWLVRIAGIEITHQGVWEGLRAGRWQDSHLKTIQNELARNDVFDGLSPCLRAERTLFTRTLLQSPATILNYLTPTAVTPLLFVDWAPKGWFYSSALEVSLLIDQLDMACAARLSIRGFPFASTQMAIWDRAPTARNYLARMTWSNMIHKHWLKACRAQTSVNLAITACALERFFLRYASYPDTLNELVPEFLESVPIDHADGKALRYRRSQDGRYRIYSVGLDGEDENGKLLRASQNEWVWCYAEEETDWQRP